MLIYIIVFIKIWYDFTSFDNSKRRQEHVSLVQQACQVRQAPYAHQKKEHRHNRRRAFSTISVTVPETR